MGVNPSIQILKLKNVMKTAKMTFVVMPVVSTVMKMKKNWTLNAKARKKTPLFLIFLCLEIPSLISVLVKMFSFATVVSFMN